MVTTYPNTQIFANQPVKQQYIETDAVVPRFDMVMKQLNPLLKTSILLGVCEDGFPLMLNMEQWEIGPILIVGDNWFGNQQHLDRMLRSASVLNPVNEVNSHLISAHLGGKSDLIQATVSGQMYNASDLSSRILLEELFRLGLDRSKGLNTGAVQLLGIDGLDVMLNKLDQSTLEIFEWLLRNGPRVGIWVVASIASNHFDKRLNSHLNLFNTRAYGRIESPKESMQIVGKPFVDLSRQFPGVESVIRHHGEDTKVLIPQL